MNIKYFCNTQCVAASPVNHHHHHVIIIIIIIILQLASVLLNLYVNKHELN
jgi:hypothetical protein